MHGLFAVILPTEPLEMCSRCRFELRTSFWFIFLRESSVIQLLPTYSAKESAFLQRSAHHVLLTEGHKTNFLDHCNFYSRARFGQE